jgi:Flp pilus assembly protein CpaB
MSVESVAGVPKKKGLLSGAKSYWVLALVVAALAAGGALSILGSAADQVSYWVLNQNVAARTQIQPEMLTEVRTSNGGQPRVAYDLPWIQQNTDRAFTKIPLSAGDILTKSNIGPLTRITDGLPKDFVVASVAVDAADAVAGKIRRGDYVEVAATSDDPEGKVSKIVLHHVLVLDVTVAPKSIPQAANDGQAGETAGQPGPESAAVRGGIPSLYTVAVSPKDFTKLSLLKGTQLSLALSANQGGPNTNAQTSETDVFNGNAVGDSGAGTSLVDPDPESQSAQQPDATADPAWLRDVPAADGEPTWCGPYVSYLAYMAKNPQPSGQADDPKVIEALTRRAGDAQAAAEVKGIPEDLKTLLLDTARLNARIAATKGNLTDADNALGRKVTQADSYKYAKTDCAKTAS